jgi:hypothetical protein
MKKVMILAACFAFGMKAHAQPAEVLGAALWNCEDSKPVAPVFRLDVYEAVSKVFADEKQAEKFIQGKKRNYKDFEVVDFVYKVNIDPYVGENIVIEKYYPEKIDSLIYKINNVSELEGRVKWFEAQSDCGIIAVLVYSYEENEEWVTESILVQKVEKGIQIVLGKSYN